MFSGVFEYSTFCCYFIIYLHLYTTNLESILPPDLMSYFQRNSTVQKCVCKTQLIFWRPLLKIAKMYQLFKLNKKNNLFWINSFCYFQVMIIIIVVYKWCIVIPIKCEWTDWFLLFLAYLAPQSGWHSLSPMPLCSGSDCSQKRFCTSKCVLNLGSPLTRYFGLSKVLKLKWMNLLLNWTKTIYLLI